MSANDARDLARDISALMAGKDLPTCATALAEVLAILIVWQAKDDEKERQRVAEAIAATSVGMASLMSEGLLKVLADQLDKQEAERLDKLAATGPKRSSPWGEPR